MGGPYGCTARTDVLNDKRTVESRANPQVKIAVGVHIVQLGSRRVNILSFLARLFPKPLGKWLPWQQDVAILVHKARGRAVGAITGALPPIHVAGIRSAQHIVNPIVVVVNELRYETHTTGDGHAGGFATALHVGPVLEQGLGICPVIVIDAKSTIAPSMTRAALLVHLTFE